MSSRKDQNEMNRAILNPIDNCFGTATSKFNGTDATIGFGWELTVSEMKAAVRKGSAVSPPIKDIEFHSDILYSGRFSMAFDENANASIHATMHHEENVTGKAQINSIQFYYIINGTAKYYGSFIPRSTFNHVMSQNGRIEIVADLNKAGSRDPVNDENLELPSDIE